jgi:hypothetical protein
LSNSKTPDGVTAAASWAQCWRLRQKNKRTRDEAGSPKKGTRGRCHPARDDDEDDNNDDDILSFDGFRRYSAIDNEDYRRRNPTDTVDKVRSKEEE